MGVWLNLIGFIKASVRRFHCQWKWFVKYSAVAFEVVVSQGSILDGLVHKGNKKDLLFFSCQHLASTFVLCFAFPVSQDDVVPLDPLIQAKLPQIVGWLLGNPKELSSTSLLLFEIPTANLDSFLNETGFWAVSLTGFSLPGVSHWAGTPEMICFPSLSGKEKWRKSQSSLWSEFCWHTNATHAVQMAKGCDGNIDEFWIET